MSEIARAFLSRDETLKKRHTRAKAVLASSKKLLDEAAVRRELCEEAMRRIALLCENASTATPPT